MSCALYSWSIMGRIWSSSEIYNQWADTPRTTDQCFQHLQKALFWTNVKELQHFYIHSLILLLWILLRRFWMQKHSWSERETCWLRVSAILKFIYVIHWQRDAPAHTSRAWFMQSMIVPPGARGVVDGIAVFVLLHSQGSPKLLQRGSEMAMISAKGFQILPDTRIWRLAEGYLD